MSTDNIPSPRKINHYGQIVLWHLHTDVHASDTFDRDLYMVAGNAGVHHNQYGDKSCPDWSMSTQMHEYPEYEHPHARGAPICRRFNVLNTIESRHSSSFQR